MEKIAGKAVAERHGGGNASGARGWQSGSVECRRVNGDVSERGLREPLEYLSAVLRARGYEQGSQVYFCGIFRRRTGRG
jgi:hypothetical protein